MKHKLIISALTAVIITITVFILSCTESSNAIFYTLENETKVVDNSLNNTLTVVSLVRDGTNYYAAAGSIFYRAASGAADTTWKPANLSGVTDTSGAKMLCNKLVVFNSRYFASFVSRDGSEYGLYSTGSLGSTITWDAVASPNIAGKQIDNLMVVNSTLLAATRESSSPNTYNLYYSTDGTTFSAADALTGQPLAVIDAAYNSSASMYWVITGSKIFKGSSLSALSEITYTSPLSVPVQGFGGIFYSGGFSRLFVSTKNGIIYSSGDDGTTWDTVYGNSVKVSGKEVPFGGFVQVTGSLLFTATNGYGFYRITGDITKDGNVTRFPGSTISELYNGIIINFYVDSTTIPPTVFIGTYGSGLWSNTTPDSDTGWKWE